MKKRYRKRYRTLTAQVALLEKRGLEIDLPRLDAEAFLRVANYYRFTGFALPFMRTRPGKVAVFVCCVWGIWSGYLV